MNLTVLNVGQNYRINGGSDRYLFDLSDLLADRGHCVVPFATRHEDNVNSEWKDYFPPRVDFSNPSAGDIARYVYSPRARKSLSGLLDNVDVDIAHLHIYYGQLSASILAPLRKRGIPIVQTLHEYKSVCPTFKLLNQGRICEKCKGGHFWHAAIERCNRGSLPRSLLSATEAYVSSLAGAVKHIDHFIAVSHFQRQKLIEMGLPEKKIATIHNYTSATSVTPSTAPGDYFLFFGRLEPEKGVWDLVHAIETIPGAKLVIAGDGTQRQALHDFSERHPQLGIEVVGFCGDEKIQELITGALATCVPSAWYETFGLTIIESFSRCRPVVASSIGGMPEVVTDGVDGLLFEPGNVSALAEKLAWMMSHRQQAFEMGKRGQEKLAKEFGADEHYRRIMRVYKRVLDLQ